MTYAPQKPIDVPPYQLQPLLSNVVDSLTRTYSSRKFGGAR